MALILNKWKNKVAVVTGASVGIGAAIAEKLVKEGLKVVVLTRRVEKVDEYAKRLSGESGKLYGYKVDITQDEKVLEAFNWVLKNVGPVSILVNNAGVYKETTLINGETQLWKLTLDTNVLGLSICTREAIKQMQANNIDGQIIHIGSIPVYVLPNSPSFNMYTPAKQAVASLTEMLRQELNQIKSKIKVSCIQPGAVNTEALADYFDDETLKTMPCLQAADIADVVSYILSTPPHVQIHELTIKPIGEEF